MQGLPNSATHVLTPRIDEAAVRTALQAGHAYFSHDWMCDAAAFRCAASSRSAPTVIMGDEVKPANGLKLTASFCPCPLMRLLRYGEEVATSNGKATIAGEVSDVTQAADGSAR